VGNNVLVIDDDPAILRLATIILRMDGHHVEAFDSAEVALGKLGNGFAPDVIVLDLNMPGMTGPEFYSAARDAGFQKAVVIVSAYGAESACKELGADAALPKPFMPDDLSDIVKRVLA
jgi:CheY-like chemotaxis protein